MAQAEGSREYPANNTDITGRLAYRVGTYFLSPMGVRSVQYFPIQAPSLDAARETAAFQPADPMNEVAWVEFYASVEFSTLINGKEHGAHGKPLIQTGETFLATGLEDDAYQLAPLTDLIENPDLPIYTAEWFSRFMYRASSLKLDNPGREPNLPFKALHNKAPLAKHTVTVPKLDGTPFTRIEWGEERSRRLTRAAAAAYPHLEQRYIDRGILKN